MNARQLAYLLVGVLMLFVAYDSVFTVDQRQRVLLFELDKVKATDLAPGLHFKLPFVESIMKLDGRVLTLDGQTANFPTADQKVLQATYYVHWKIADPIVFYRVTGDQTLEAQEHLAAVVNRVVGDAFGTHTAAQIVGNENDQIVTELLENSRDQATALGVTVLDVRFTHIDLPEQVADSVYQRMRAEQNRIAADLRARAAEAADKIRADADAQAEVLLADAYRDAEKMRGDGDAKASEIYARAYEPDPEFYRFYRSINAYRDGFQSGRDVLVLEPKGEFFRYFNGSGNGAGNAAGAGGKVGGGR